MHLSVEQRTWPLAATLWERFLWNECRKGSNLSVQEDLGETVRFID